jgi:type I restriction enzyme R subunit
MANERETQDRVIKLFEEKLGYTYLGNFSDSNNKNIMPKLLQDYLKKAGYSFDLIKKGIYDILAATNDQNHELYDVNKKVYSLLRYGHSISLAAGQQSEHIDYINWKNPEKNDFSFAEEVSVHAKNGKRPDIVVYINGIAVAVLELKRSSVSISEGIRQNISSQDEKFIRPFFSTVQMTLAGNDSEGLRYGTTGTLEKHYLAWKEDTKATDKVSQAVIKLQKQDGYSLDNNLISLFYKKRLLDILYNFIIFDGGKKKLCRHNQYFGVNAAKERAAKKEGGIIWHTQGSGKSLSMVWLSRIIKESNSKARVLIVTDREELDDQISRRVFGPDGSGDDIYRTKSCADLIEKLNANTPVTLCSLIFKFGKKNADDDDKNTDKAYNSYIEEIKRSLPSNFKAKGEFYVFVDECHRTQSGKLHEAMKTIIPDAIFIGFTGTPLLAKQKNPERGEKSSIEVFGTYIHTYKYDEAVKDGVVLDLRYEARDVPQDLTSKQKIDEWFEIKTRGLTNLAKAQLKRRWGTLQNIFSSEPRLKMIMSDIIFDMERYSRLSAGHGNAILVASSIYDACRYYDLFQKTDINDKCAIITSYEGDPSSIKLDDTGEGETENLFKFNTYNNMLNGQNATDFEKEAKRKFVKEPARMKLLIVVDKLLTGFDAPPATYLYIDKQMKDHGLFQAICRVNRLDDEEKDFGYIIDYKDLFGELKDAINDYTTSAFAEYEKVDVQGLLKSRADEAKRHFYEILESIRRLTEHIELPQESLQYEHYFCTTISGDVEKIKENEPKRLAFYKLTASLVRAWADFAPYGEKSLAKNEFIKLVTEVMHYIDMRDCVKLSSGDYIDLKAYEPAMRHLLDNYIAAANTEVLSTLNDLSLIEIIIAEGELFIEKLPEKLKKDEEAVAEAIENNVRKKIIEKNPTNPKYYEEISKLLDELIKMRRQKTIEYKEYLNKIAEITKRMMKPENETKYPVSVRGSAAKRAFYSNITQDEKLITELDKIILQGKDADWYGDKTKEMALRGVIYEVIKDEDIVEKIFEIVKEQTEYR